MSRVLYLNIDIACVHGKGFGLASTLNASDQEVDQFMYLSGSVGAIIDGDDPDIIEQDVADYLDVPDISEDDGQLYSHLQEHEREMRMAIDEYNRKQHEPEVHHLEEVPDGLKVFVEQV